MSQKVEINSVEKHFVPPLGELCLAPLQGPKDPISTSYEDININDIEELNIQDILSATED
jgi:hypothetical protein